jgi:CheY-like chemotaxis protein
LSTELNPVLTPVLTPALEHRRSSLLSQPAMDAILLVEDDQMLGRALTAALGQEGWHVVHCQDAGSARLALVDHAFVAVLLDLGLPGGSGLDVLTTMRGTLRSDSGADHYRARSAQ